MKLKIIVGISILIFWSIATAIIVAGILSKQSQNNVTSSVSTTKQKLVNVTLDNQEIAKHNKSSDCWSIINNKVYDLTSYLNAHRGAFVITPFCGRDGSFGYNTKNIGRRHSNNADSLLSRYLLGNLNEIIGSDALQNIQNITPPSTQGREDD